MHSVPLLLDGIFSSVVMLLEICSRSSDLLELLVTSIPCKNKVLCMSIVPKATESQKVYTITYADLSKAVKLLCQVLQSRCPDSDFDCCTKIRELLAAQNVVEYVGSAKFKAQKLQVETAMCDNFQGLGNFCSAESEMDPILCKPHATSK
jgi:hypothetical protein